MIIVDSGFLYALADRSDAWHDAARAQVHTLDEGWISTWAVATETCHLLGKRLGTAYTTAFIDDLAAGDLVLWNPPQATLSQAAVLMRKYARLPMDLADASLVLLAEHLDDGRILSTDQRDFGAYRWKNRKPFHNLLGDAP